MFRAARPRLIAAIPCVGTTAPSNTMGNAYRRHQAAAGLSARLTRRGAGQAESLAIQLITSLGFMRGFDNRSHFL